MQTCVMVLDGYWFSWLRAVCSYKFVILKGISVINAMLRLKHVLAILLSALMTYLVVWESFVNPWRQQKHYFDSPSRPHPSGLELWRNVPLTRWKPCSWWTEGALPTASLTVVDTNGYIIIRCSGGLNQMRRDLCHGVGIARLLNATLILPRFEASSYWNDSSGFGDIFDIDFFVESVRGWVDVLRDLPADVSMREPVAITCHKVTGAFDYVESLLPKLLQHKVIIVRPSASQRSDRYPDCAKRARCQACHRSLRLVKSLRETADAILQRLPHPFIALHLRFEPDMIAYSRCRFNLSSGSMASINRVRGSRQVLGEAAEMSRRKKGKCPLTPLETAFILRALNIPASTAIYLAAGSGLLELQALTSSFSLVLQKSDFLDADRLGVLRGSSRAAIDWYVSLHAHVYIATFVGNMEKMVVADRTLAGKHRNAVLDGHAFAEAKWRGEKEADMSALMLVRHRQHVTSGDGLPMSDCFCKISFVDSLQDWLEDIKLAKTQTQ